MATHLLVWPSFANEGAKWIHMVDFDGAKDGKRVNDRFVIEAAKELEVKFKSAVAFVPKRIFHISGKWY